MSIVFVVLCVVCCCAVYSLSPVSVSLKAEVRFHGGLTTKPKQTVQHVFCQCLCLFTFLPKMVLPPRVLCFACCQDKSFKAPKQRNWRKTYNHLLNCTRYLPLYLSTCLDRQQQRQRQANTIILVIVTSALIQGNLFLAASRFT